MLFDDVKLSPADPIYGLMEHFKVDEREGKVNLGIGVYKDAFLQTPKMEAVKLAERKLLEDECDKVYLPIEGDGEFCDLGGQLIFGEGFWEGARGRYSSPPRRSALIVREALGDARLKGMWKKELTSMRLRIRGMRELLCAALKERLPGADLSYLKGVKGMFFLTGLSGEQVDQMIQKYGIYMTLDGRMNIAGLSDQYVDKVADALSRVMRS